MGAWTFLIGWYRFTVPDSTVDEVLSLVGGDWMKDKKGFQGYTQAWISRGNGGGLGRIGTGASWSGKEVHVDLSQEWLSGWTYEHFQKVASWVLEKQGHFARLDVALDDRNGVVDVPHVYQAVEQGHCVTRFRQSRLIAGLNLDTGSDMGKTLCMGSRQSDTYLRVYDKAAEQKEKGSVVEGPWMRWEMEWKDDRATAVAMAIAQLPHDTFRRYIVGVFRSALDFRECTREDGKDDRYHAPLLSWWKALTEGMQRATLEMKKAVRKIEDVKQWAEKSLSPMLGLLCAHPEAGERWLVKTIVEGVDRWRAKHLALLENSQEVRKLRRKLRYWNPRNGFSAAFAEPAL